MKKIKYSTKLLSVLFLVILSSFLFVGCGSKQLTIKQVTDFFNEYIPKTNTIDCYVNSAMLSHHDLLYDDHVNDFSLENIRWQRKLEIQNISTENFMLMEKMTFFIDGVYKSNEVYMYLFKFESKKAAKQMQKNYKFEEDMTSRQYGNLVIAIDNLIQEDCFKQINAL